MRRSQKFILLNYAHTTHFSFYWCGGRALQVSGGRQKLNCAITCKFCISSACRCYWRFYPRFIGCIGYVAASQILVPLCQYAIAYSQVGKIYQAVWKVRSLSSLSFRVCLLFTPEIHCPPVAKWQHCSRDLNHSGGLELLNPDLLSLLAEPSRFTVY